jgi:hypothetical protein
MQVIGFTGLTIVGSALLVSFPNRFIQTLPRHGRLAYGTFAGDVPVGVTGALQGQAA